MGCVIAVTSTRSLQKYNRLFLVLTVSLKAKNKYWKLSTWRLRHTLVGSRPSSRPIVVAVVVVVGLGLLVVVVVVVVITNSVYH